MKEEKKRSLSTTQVVAMGFFTAILIGTFILMLPVCSADGEVTGFVDALFTATTSVCVSGLVVVDTFSHCSTIGHVVILILRGDTALESHPFHRLESLHAFVLF